MSDKSILIVDDNEGDRYLLKRDIKKTEFSGHVFESENGKEALDFLTDFEKNKAEYKEKFPPTIIFLDINMPLIDGFEFLEKFSEIKKQSNDFDSIFIMMFSSSENQRDIEKANSYGFVKKYLIKGNYEIEELKDTLNNYI
ncbi:MAG: response regulator [Gammaproteobacteria bacterium]|jgi:CheY-like chemotaxis protein